MVQGAGRRCALGVYHVTGVIRSSFRDNYFFFFELFHYFVYCVYLESAPVNPSLFLSVSFSFLVLGALFSFYKDIFQCFSRFQPREE